MENPSDSKALTPQNRPKTEIYDVSTLYNGIQQPINEKNQSVKENKEAAGYVTLSMPLITRAKLISIKNNPDIDIPDRSWNGFFIWLMDYIEQLENKLEALEHGRVG